MTPPNPRRILIIEGHPDPAAGRLNQALADAYAQGAEAGGHEVRRVRVAALDFPLLQSQHDWAHGTLPAGLQSAQDAIGWAQHVALFFPLWLGDMPAVLKGFLEQVARPGFAFKEAGGNPFGHKGLSGRSARVVVTMGMPALVYRWYFRAHSLKSLERNILGFVGFAPIHHSLVGGVEQLGPVGVARWQTTMRKLGQQAA